VCSRDDGSKMIIPLVRAPKNIEDEVAVGDGAAEVAQGVRHALHLVTVVTHREVTLYEVAEHGVEVKYACFSFDDELVLDRVPDLARSNAKLLDDVLKLIGDRAKDPREDNTLHAHPSRVVDGRGIGEDVVGEVIALQNE
jgi:hypothetical protein